MRLRSSQFVFMLLLVCSVQIREAYATQLLEGAIAGRCSVASQHTDAAQTPAEPIDRLNLHLVRPAQSTTLDAASLAAHRIAWQVRQPICESVAISSFTSFLRA